ncbi:MAG: hypothetical protein IKL44_04245 [Clostridia bacterium]|nr:hypothetical protein [Clostridia bacterium]
MFDYKDYFVNRTPLDNTLSCLKKGKKLNVLYFGGSVTMGVGLKFEDLNVLSWRAKTGNWIAKHFPEATVTNINRAVGESGTYLGCFRVERDVIAHKPDLLFIEYSINDCYFGSTYYESAMRFETIVREVRKALPYCDIVTVLVTDKRRCAVALEGKLHEQAAAHDDISKAYGIPSVKVGMALANKLGDTLEDRWSEHFTDIVHLTEKGYDEYYKCIEAFLETELLRADTPEKTAHTLPPVQCDKLFDGDRTVNSASAELLEKSGSLGGHGFVFCDKYFGLHDYNGYFLAKRGGENPVLAIEFEGTEIAINSNVATGVAREESVWCFEVAIDGGEWVRRNFKTHNPTMIAEGLPAGKHTVLFRPLFETFEKDEDFKLGIIFTRDAEKQTVR